MNAQSMEPRELTAERDLAAEHLAMSASHLISALGPDDARLALSALRAGWLTPPEARRLLPLASELARRLGARIPPHRGVAA